MVVPECEFGKNGVFLYADSGLVENPDADQLSESPFLQQVLSRSLLKLSQE